MTSSDLRKRMRDSFLLSLILHVIIAIVLGFALHDYQQEKVKESLSVDMVEAMERKIPDISFRTIQKRESFPDFRRIRDQESKSEFKPQTFKVLNTDIKIDSRTPGMKVLIPELTTDASKLKSRFEYPLPDAKGIGATIVKPGEGGGKSSRGSSGGGSLGLSNGAGLLETALYWVARNIVSRNKTGKEDIVFLIDSSGSMEENIAAVAKYISNMIDIFEESKLDYTIGVIKFNRILKVNDIKIYEQTKDLYKIRSIFRSIKCDGDENTFDAIEVGLTQVEYRDPVDKTFILVTDESFKPRTITKRPLKTVDRKTLIQQDFHDILKMVKNADVKINILGIDDQMHKIMAKETGGLWFQIPQQDNLP